MAKPVLHHAHSTNNLLLSPTSAEKLKQNFISYVKKLDSNNSLKVRMQGIRDLD